MKLKVTSQRCRKYLAKLYGVCRSITFNCHGPSGMIIGFLKREVSDSSFVRCVHSEVVREGFRCVHSVSLWININTYMSSIKPETTGLHTLRIRINEQ